MQESAVDYPNVRQAQRTDQDAVGALWLRLLEEQARLEDRFGVADDARERWENDFPVWLDDETRCVFVAEGEEELVGFATGRRWGPPPVYEESLEVFFDELYVHPDHRRQGFGTQLVHALRDWADELGARRLRLRVLTANNAARQFWAAQNAVPMTMTLTLERPAEADTMPDEGSKKIGF